MEWSRAEGQGGGEDEVRNLRVSSTHYGEVVFHEVEISLMNPEVKYPISWRRCIDQWSRAAS